MQYNVSGVISDRIVTISPLNIPALESADAVFLMLSKKQHMLFFSQSI